MSERIRRWWRWMEATPERTWISHALVGLLVAVPFGAWAAVVYFFLRELFQLLEKWRDGVKLTPTVMLDAWLDFGVPSVIVGQAVVFLGLHVYP